MNTTPTSLYTLHFFRGFFAARKRWTTRILYNASEDACCALGHVGAVTTGINSISTRFDDHPVLTPMGRALTELFAPLNNMSYFGFNWNGHFISGKQSSGMHAVANINNGDDPRYQQATPQLRILAAIDDLIAMQNAKLAAEHERIESRPLIAVERPAPVAPAAVTEEALS